MKRYFLFVFVAMVVLNVVEAQHFARGPRLIPWLMLFGLIFALALVVFTRVLNGPVPPAVHAFIALLRRITDRVVRRRVDREVARVLGGKGLTDTPRR